MLCVMAAADTPAVKACLEVATKAYVDKSKKTEASLQLNKLSKNPQGVLHHERRVPKGQGQAPARDRVLRPVGSRKCAVTKAWEKDPMWSALDFQIDEADLFQYTYESDGKTFKATAVGDVGCTGHPQTFTASGKVVNGNVTVEIVEPKP